ncbi:hypothetical protein NDK47_06175 [Brevibacillus ruminantium]|uniref:Uncharacterized protein n=1 Tax=Brevibacillus ruminantium TaxID=2950604 RepID=A0ABY4WIA8_9BACL|nr:hypothetical protein [Brevibacillus ruminantium]USG66883.1 hypothetical protein NDK47_06175 [Brevibacillus ruminantium]
MIETIVVPVDKKMRRVPVLTAQHLQVYKWIVSGTDVNEVVKDRKMRRYVNELCRLGWLESRADKRTCG